MHTMHETVWHHCLSVTLLVEWPVSFLNLFGLICSLPVMLWKQGPQSFSLCRHDKLLWPFMQNLPLETQHVLISALPAKKKKKTPKNIDTTMWVAVSWRRKRALIRSNYAWSWFEKGLLFLVMTSAAVYAWQWNNSTYDGLPYLILQIAI